MTKETIGKDLQLAFPTLVPELSEAEVLTRAREAYIAVHKPWRWVRRRVRMGHHDGKLHAIITALRDLARPMTAIVADRDTATCALIMKATPNIATLDEEQKIAVGAALMTAIRMGRRG